MIMPERFLIVNDGESTPTYTASITPPAGTIYTLIQNTYTATTSVPAPTYTWSVGSGVTILSGQGTASLIVTFDSAGSRTVSLAVGGGGSAAATWTGTVTAWMPSLIADLGLWLDADYAEGFLTLDVSGNVTQWTDRSSFGRHATQTVVLSRPAYTPNAVNGRPAVTFNGTSHFMNGVAFAGTEPFTLFTVVKKLGTGSGGGAHHFNFNPGGSVFGLAINTNPDTQQGGLIDMTAWRQDGVNVATNAVVRQTVTKSAGVHVYTRNGGITFTNNVPSTSAAQVSNYELGRHSGSAYANVALCDAIFYSRLLTAGERNQVHAYLDSKWGI